MGLRQVEQIRIGWSSLTNAAHMIAECIPAASKGHVGTITESQC